MHRRDIGNTGASLGLWAAHTPSEPLSLICKTKGSAQRRLSSSEFRDVLEEIRRWGADPLPATPCGPLSSGGRGRRPPCSVLVKCFPHASCFAASELPPKLGGLSARAQARPTGKCRHLPPPPPRPGPPSAPGEGAPAAPVSPGTAWRARGSVTQLLHNVELQLLAFAMQLIHALWLSPSSWSPCPLHS